MNFNKKSLINNLIHIKTFISISPPNKYYCVKYLITSLLKLRGRYILIG